jgi:predicted GNAT superfamily acetyltransferase
MLKENLTLVYLEVNVEPPNPGSMRFHLKNNFKIIKENHKHHEGFVVNLMVKQLSPPGKSGDETFKL